MSNNQFQNILIIFKKNFITVIEELGEGKLIFKIMVPLFQ